MAPQKGIYLIFFRSKKVVIVIYLLYDPFGQFYKIGPCEKVPSQILSPSLKMEKNIPKNILIKKNCRDGHFKEPFYQKTFLKTYFLFPSGVFAAMALFSGQIS